MSLIHINPYHLSWDYPYLDDPSAFFWIQSIYPLQVDIDKAVLQHKL